MKEERLRILAMLENGKINAEEAAKLLETVQKSERGYHGFRRDFDEGDREAWDEKVKEFRENAEKFARDVQSRASGVYKDVEPKLKKATKVVVEKTAGIIEDLSRALNETLKKFEENGECGCEEEKKECDCGCNGDDDKPKEN